MSGPTITAAPPSSPRSGRRPAGGPADDPGRERTIRPRRGLPGGRAVVGGLLVALAALGTFSAMATVGDGPSTRYLVAAHDLRVGTTLTTADLGTVAIELPGPVERSAYRESAQNALVGHLVRAPLGKGSLIPVGAVASPRGARIPTFAFAVPAADALGGALRPGDAVDVYVTFGTGTASRTRRIAEAALVVDAGTGGTGVGDAGKVQVTLALGDPEARIELVNAAHAGAVSLARSARSNRANPARASAGSAFAETDGAGVATPSSVGPSTSEAGRPTTRPTTATTATTAPGPR